jgi:hypothetical protein
MNNSATGKVIALVAFCVIALSVQCGSSPPVVGGPPSSAGGGGAISLSSPHGLGGKTGSSGSSAGGGNIGGPPANPDANCGTQTSNMSQQPADLLLVLDRSGSMNDDIASNGTCGGKNAPANCTARWPTMTTALSQVLTSSPAGVQWGLKFFTSPNGGSCGVNPGADVAVGPNTAAQIQAAIAGTTPGSQTPTTAAITAAAAYLKTVNDGLTHYILLATDGQPNCDPGTSSSTTPAVVANTVAAIAAAAGANINTYVIGIGPSAGNLDNFAAAGGTTKFYPATSPADLTAALSSIAGQVASCVFKMGAAPPDPTNIGVYLDKTTKVPQDGTNGYTLGADNITVTFTGTYCTGITAGTYKIVQVFFGCNGVSPPSFIP